MTHVTQEQQSPDERQWGMGQAQQTLSGGGAYYPQLKLGGGDRAWFWCLSTGGDKWFAASAFHEFGEGRTYRSISCLQSLLNEECQFCNDGHNDMSRQFAFWVWAECILHNGQNPDADGAEWELVSFKEGGKQRHFFKEVVEAPLVLQLRAGRGQSRFKMFMQQYTEKGSLQTCKYQVTRVGTGTDTEYFLQAFKPGNPAPPEGIFEKVASLTPIWQLFKGGVSSYTPAASIEGADALSEPSLLADALAVPADETDLPSPFE